MNNAEEDLYLPEKSSVLGELSSRMRQAGTESYKNRRDDEDFLPPPPVFETFNSQLSEKDDVDDLPPPPTPLQSGECCICCELVDRGGCTANGKTYHQQCFKCSNCRNILQDKFFTADDQPLCELCYKELTCPTCEVCGDLVDGDGVVMKEEEKLDKEKKEVGMKEERVYHSHCLTCSYCTNTIQGKFYTQSGKIVCGGCAATQVENKVCEMCNKAIEGDCLMSKGKHFHEECMKCSVCGESLRGTYFTHMDKLICEKDYQETQQTCSECGVVISGPYYTLDNDRVVCEEDYRKMLGNCERCGKVVEGKILKVSEGFYHPECFTCVVCDINLVGVPFSRDDDKKVYCSDDYKKKHAALCSACSEHIVPKKGETTAARIRALGRDFHPECFKCEDCGLVLDSRKPGSECYPVNNTPLCLECSKNRQT